MRIRHKRFVLIGLIVCLIIFFYNSKISKNSLFSSINSFINQFENKNVNTGLKSRLKLNSGYSKIKVKLSKVIDGDTAYFYFPDRKKKVRFLWINTEETKHKDKYRSSIWGYKATEYTINKFRESKDIQIETKLQYDVFKRVLGVVWIDGKDFSLELISRGLSPYYMKYGCPESLGRHNNYLNAQNEAIQKNIGIWSDKNRKEVYLLKILPLWNKGCRYMND